MKLSVLLEHVKTESAYQDSDIKFITDKFNEVEKGCVFICIEGRRFDAHTVAADALGKGAAAVVVQKDMGLENQILVENSRAAYSIMCSAMYGNPTEKMKMIGITGTNGKTTTAFLIKDILERAGHKTGLIGTVVNLVGSEQYASSLTTPDPAELFSLFEKMVQAGCEYCVMEVSSQALEQERVAGIVFDIAVFTNLTQDHLDYHGSMEKYKAAKHKLFENARRSVINIDDEAGEYMMWDCAAEAKTYSIKNDAASYTAKNIKLRDNGVSYEFVGSGIISRIKLNIPGAFSVYNSMAAAIAALEAGVKLDIIASVLHESTGVKGRMETVPTDRDYTVIIDYAHSPDGLENVLKALKAVYKGKIITVFGCGGDRDKAKRPIMGKIAGDLSDIAVVTSDNPRSEDPDQIVEDILAGMKQVKAKVVSVVDRTQAIEKALGFAQKGDVVLLAGKGHETYQVLAGGKIHYDEREIIKDLLSK